MIALRNVAKRLGGHEVLRGVNLDVTAGTITSIVGPNAAGKTTLLKMMLGLMRPDRGAVLFDGTVMGDDPGSRHRIGYMPQFAHFPDHLTARELLVLMTALRPESAGRVDRELIDLFALESELSKPLRTLSGGTSQKVNAAIAFLFAPDLLILDEPTAGLDPVASGVLKRKIARCHASGTTVLLASHIMSDLEELSDRVVFLLEGRVQFAGAIHDLKVRTRERTLERAIARLMTDHREAA